MPPLPDSYTECYLKYMLEARKEHAQTEPEFCIYLYTIEHMLKFI